MILFLKFKAVFFLQFLKNEANSGSGFGVLKSVWV